MAVGDSNLAREAKAKLQVDTQASTAPAAVLSPPSAELERFSHEVRQRVKVRAWLSPAG